MTRAATPGCIRVTRGRSRAFACSLVLGLSLVVRASAQPGAGVISGTVLDTDGVPVPDLMVVVERAPGSTSDTTSATRTDSGGRYHLTVPPGRYLVKTGGCPRDRSGQECSTSAPIYIYHPNTTSRAQATVVSMNPDATRDHLDFVVSRAAVMEMQREGARLRTLAPQLWGLRSSAPAPTARWRSIDEMHHYFVSAFIATPGLGSGRMSGLVLQIDPEQRLLLPYEGTRSTGAPASDEQSAWSVKELNLIGIAMHEHPVVFSRVAHAAYAEADRALTSFERQSLDSLHSGSDVVSGRGESGAMVVLGAIRAESACLACHRSQNTGALLGAFRYVLQPSAPKRP